ncbi:SET domain-containing protein SmydA-8-like isoform X3 [Rhodnius prolixus]|uniref:SET domain-containing protein SmydA-8-like isoform X3 n=1 Tax=Rhodnius prolixus TaxID=13249 RepID=UPI003D18936F
MGKNKKCKETVTKTGEKKENEPDNLLEMKTSNIMGRYLVAKEDIKPGTIILRVPPLVLGPTCINNTPICLSCYAPINDLVSCERCNQCGWPICGSGCKAQYLEDGHSDAECNALRKSTRKPETSKDYHLYNIILPLRVALLKLSNPCKWAEIQKMQSHTKFRKKNKELWNNNQKMIDCMKMDCGITEFSDQEMHSICGYLQTTISISVNSFSIENLALSGLYGKAFLLAHDCVPNTAHVFDSKFWMIIHATTLISKGDAVTLSYANTLQGTMARRAYLKETKYFNCSCKRCSDITELGTFLSGVKCYSCNAGYLLPVDPLDMKSVWRCSCESEKKAEYIFSLVERIFTEAESIKNKGIDEMEAFILKYSSTLHPNHYILFSIKCLLSQLYGKFNNYLIQDLSQDMLNRKAELCKYLLDIFDIIEPGLSRIRGITMYEFHAPLMIIASQKYQNKNEKVLKQQLRQVKHLLTEANLILSFENPLTKEGQIGTAAKQALEETKHWERHIGRL